MRKAICPKEFDLATYISKICGVMHYSKAIRIIKDINTIVPEFNSDKSNAKYISNDQLDQIRKRNKMAAHFIECQRLIDSCEDPFNMLYMIGVYSKDEDIPHTDEAIYKAPALFDMIYDDNNELTINRYILSCTNNLPLYHILINAINMHCKDNCMFGQFLLIPRMSINNWYGVGDGTIQLMDDVRNKFFAPTKPSSR